MKSLKIGEYITIYDNREDKFRGKGTPKIQINWSALGSVKIRKAEQFSRQLIRAIKIAKVLK